MKKSRFNEAQIIGVLREQEAGSPTAEVCRRHGISEQALDRISDWIETMVDRLVFAMRMRQLHPGAGSDYRDWMDPPSDDDDLGAPPSAAPLIPLLAAWASALSLPRARARLAKLRKNVLAHTTMQMWLPTARPTTISTARSKVMRFSICLSRRQAPPSYRLSARPATVILS